MNKYAESLSNKSLKKLNNEYKEDSKIELNSTCSSSMSLEKFNNKSADNLNKLHPAYVTGFCDGEACFHLAIGENARYKLGYYVNPGFTIALHKKEEELILKLKEYFGGVGVVKPSSRDNLVEYRVFAIKDLDIILMHFDQNPLISKKAVDYLLFKEALELIKDKQHLTVEGFNLILAIRASINKGLPEKLQEKFPYIKGKTQPTVVLPESLNPYWVAGFMDAEGCFFVKSLYNKNKDLKFVLGCQITQHSRDSLLMHKICYFFNCGRVEVNRKIYDNFVVTKLSDINKFIIPFFRNYHIIGYKRKEFEDWVEIAKLMTSKAHMTEKGREKILKIKLGMNTFRGRDNN